MVTMDDRVIQSARLDLVLLTADFLRSSLEQDHAAAEAVLGAHIPTAWFQQRDFIAMRLAQVEADPAYRPWMPRAMVLREKGQMVGHLGFHTGPGPAYLDELAPGGIEFGYTVFPEFRQQGFATEASVAIMEWARQRYDVQRFVLSISPGNVPSRRIAQRLGFTQIGTQIDPEDGPEDVFEHRFDVAP
ncbi:MAG: hypothetical protein NVS2B7_35620 [Herpetosiphon sp.]